MSGTAVNPKKITSAGAVPADDAVWTLLVNCSDGTDWTSTWKPALVWKSVNAAASGGTPQGGVRKVTLSTLASCATLPVLLLGLGSRAHADTTIEAVASTPARRKKERRVTERSMESSAECGQA